MATTLLSARALPHLNPTSHRIPFLLFFTPPPHAVPVLKQRRELPTKASRSTTRASPAVVAMAAPVPRRSASRWVLPFAFLACFALVSTASALEFRVGGLRGWHKPTGNDSETYNEWARRNRFHVGDSVYFKYQNDSVLLVDYDHYSQCNLSNPLHKFGGRNGTFTFNRHGFFYFISGQPGHCSAGQKLVIRVMVHSMNAASPQLAPAAAPTSRGSSPSTSPTANSSLKLRIDVSVAMAALVAVLASSLVLL
ncbi:hypothetical protein Taro_041787 [Colocasia esculenta]|uniref:Phytocyanin domain-containing protein n=1 Tax=Colocasia esculenta TaxID=4460 RepID=A0A843X179_COLES|nr:hypothetical protein [Colocasia esculenta]